jgi:pimeloyl-ACP methyl ester carboxylesterase
MSGRRWLRTLRRWIIRGAGGLLATVVALSLGGAVFQRFAAKSETARLRPRGEMAAVEGHAIHLHCVGQGAPTVVLEPGLGLPSPVWAWAQVAVAETTRVCTYDRAGYGWSDPTDEPMDAVNTSSKLYALLTAGNIPRPYVLVGHSIGGAYMRMFAAKYSSAVVALILVDASAPAGVDWSALREPSAFGRTSGYYFATIGGVRLVLALGFFDFWKDLPPEQGAEVKMFLSSSKHTETFMKERASLANTLRQIGALGSLGSLPLTVIYSEKVIRPDAHALGLDAHKAATFQDTIEEQKRYWLDSSTNSHFLIIPGADHISILTRNEHAKALADAIIAVVQSLRH